MRYAVVIEKTPSNYSAYVPDLPGCIATGSSVAEVQQSIRDTLRNRKEQLLRAAYMAEARDGAKVTNYLAQQVIESNGKLPEIPKFGSSALAPVPLSAPAPAPASVPAPSQP